ncbi:MAG TPA: hypothetical protein VH593_19620 [Ktedonobacteraceae bacterium]|jgi:hypothetical protein
MILKILMSMLIGLIPGIIIGVVGVLLFISSSHPSPAPASQGVNGNLTLTLQFSQAYLSKLAQQHVSSGSDLPGTVSNVQIKTTHNAPIVITADDQIVVIGLSVTRPITIDVQPYVQNCKVHMHVTHADLAGVPLTAFSASLEDQLNQQLVINSSALPHGFTYCATSVNTEDTGVFVTLTATPATLTATPAK